VSRGGLASERTTPSVAIGCIPMQGFSGNGLKHLYFCNFHDTITPVGFQRSSRGRPRRKSSSESSFTKDPPRQLRIAPKAELLLPFA